MTTQAIHLAHPDTERARLPAVNKVAPLAALHWLDEGFRILRAAPVASLLYGLLFTAACIGVLGLTRVLPWFSVAFLTGLLLIGPFLAAGLYTAARQHEAGQPVDIRVGLGLLWDRRTELSLFALFLGVVMAAWVR